MLTCGKDSRSCPWGMQLGRLPSPPSTQLSSRCSLWPLLWWATRGLGRCQPRVTRLVPACVHSARPAPCRDAEVSICSSGFTGDDARVRERLAVEQVSFLSAGAGGLREPQGWGGLQVSSGTLGVSPAPPEMLRARSSSPLACSHVLLSLGRLRCLPGSHMPSTAIGSHPAASQILGLLSYCAPWHNRLSHWAENFQS